MELFWIPLAAFVIDAIFGDPRSFPHPVQLIGSMLNRLEKTARRNFPNRLGGVLSLLILLLLVFIIVKFFIELPMSVGCSHCTLRGQGLRWAVYLLKELVLYKQSLPAQ